MKNIRSIGNVYKIQFIAAFLLLILKSNAIGTTHIIKFAGLSFTPSTLDVQVGDTIIWRGSFSFHVIENTHGAIPNGAATFGPTKSSDTALYYVVTVPGTYGYQCNTHVSMGMIGTFTAATASVKDVKSNGGAVLEKNFPNPFNSSTMLRYKLTHTSFVSIDLFDINGKQIKNLIHTQQDAGSYEVSFDGSNLPDGTYIYRLQTEEGILSQEMVLTKK